jgi:hypothetical protein
MSKTGRGPGDCLGPVPASDIDLSVDVDAPSFMVEEPDLFTRVLSCAIAGVVQTMSAAIRCFSVSYLAVVAISVRAFAERGRGETVDQVRYTRGPWQRLGSKPATTQTAGMIDRTRSKLVSLVSLPTALRFFKSLLTNERELGPEIFFRDLAIVELLGKIQPT